MFLIGDKVVHPMHGAGIIERITHERLGSRVSSYYVFRMPAVRSACGVCPRRSTSARCSPPSPRWRCRCPPTGTSATGTIWPG